MKIYMDVSNLMSISFVSGIQRVVLECAKGFQKSDGIELVLMEYVERKQCFRILNSVDFLKKYFPSESFTEDNKKVENTYIEINALEKNAWFYDVDAVWDTRISRNWLYKVLSDNGVRIAVFVHDILPISMPWLFVKNLVCSFSLFLGAVLLYSDRIIVSTNTTKDKITDFARNVGISAPEIVVSGLGGDFKTDNNALANVNEMVKEFANRKYALIVGTIEPRKNHTFLMDLFEDEMFPKDLSLVFAGRMGWKNEDVVKRIYELKTSSDRFMHFEGLNDESIGYLYKNAYVSLFPSLDEGYGLPIVESFQRGIPVITSDIPVLREVGKGCAILCSLDNKSEWLDALNRLCTDTVLYDSYKEKIANYPFDTWDDVIKRMEEGLK